MIPLAKMRKMHETAARKRAVVRASSFDHADIDDCTKDNPAECRIHGTKALAKTDEKDKGKQGVVHLEEKGIIFTRAKAIFTPRTKEMQSITTLSDTEKAALQELRSVCDCDRIEDEGNTVSVISEVIKDLNERFPKIKIPRLLSFSIAKPLKKDALASTTVVENDDTKEWFYNIVFSAQDLTENDEAYHHKDNRAASDYLRHEIGHAIAISEGIDGSAFSEWGIKVLGKEKYNEVMKSVSKRAEVDTPNGEAIAECFAKYTSSDYKGELGSMIEMFIRARMTGEVKWRKS